MIPLNVIIATLLAGLGLLLNSATTTDLILGSKDSGFSLLEILFGGLPHAFQAQEEFEHEVAAAGLDASIGIVPLPELSVIFPANSATPLTLIQSVEFSQPFTPALPTSTPVDLTIATTDPANDSTATTIAEVPTAAISSFGASNDTFSVTIPAAHRPQKASNTRSRSLVRIILSRIYQRWKAVYRNRITAILKRRVRFSRPQLRTLATLESVPFPSATEVLQQLVTAYTEAAAWTVFVARLLPDLAYRTTAHLPIRSLPSSTGNVTDSVEYISSEPTRRKFSDYTAGHVLDNIDLPSASETPVTELDYDEWDEEAWFILMSILNEICVAAIGLYIWRYLLIAVKTNRLSKWLVPNRVVLGYAFDTVTPGRLVAVSSVLDWRGSLPPPGNTNGHTIEIQAVLPAGLLGVLENIDDEKPSNIRYWRGKGRTFKYAMANIRVASVVTMWSLEKFPSSSKLTFKTLRTPTKAFSRTNPSVLAALAKPSTGPPDSFAQSASGTSPLEQPSGGEISNEEAPWRVSRKKKNRRGSRNHSNGLST